MLWSRDDVPRIPQISSHFTADVLKLNFLRFFFKNLMELLGFRKSEGCTFKY